MAAALSREAAWPKERTNREAALGCEGPWQEDRTIRCSFDSGKVVANCANASAASLQLGSLNRSRRKDLCVPKRRGKRSECFRSGFEL